MDGTQSIFHLLVPQRDKETKIHSQSSQSFPEQNSIVISKSHDHICHCVTSISYKDQLLNWQCPEQNQKARSLIQKFRISKNSRVQTNLTALLNSGSHTFCSGHKPGLLSPQFSAKHRSGTGRIAMAFNPLSNSQRLLPLATLSKILVGNE